MSDERRDQRKRALEILNSSNSWPIWPKKKKKITEDLDQKIDLKNVPSTGDEEAESIFYQSFKERTIRETERHPIQPFNQSERQSAQIDPFKEDNANGPDNQ
ncbi:hypothetical protein ACFP7A_03505 [Sporolactobacillus kofuensis]|uniref:Uncharacterized protein n=1 Tax=Sporolactobacillus kofuensis TaxID=269672 RepID=A0ABW1WEX4_9BACL|nr:hypothetical protein [Sporolactobacillus kofuensis]MCO7174533.1 hypothetical protein [Sporolactobacillus kofuensis]